MLLVPTPIRWAVGCAVVGRFHLDVAQAEATSCSNKGGPLTHTAPQVKRLLYNPI